MHKIKLFPVCWLAAVLMTLFSMSAYAQLSDITQQGDPIVPSSNSSPGSEGVANAIDNVTGTKYLNFDAANNAKPTGFTVTPNVGDTIVSGLSLTSANDAPERDPSSYVLTGSNDGSNYVSISSGSVPLFGPTGTNRFYK